MCKHVQKRAVCFEFQVFIGTLSERKEKEMKTYILTDWSLSKQFLNTIQNAHRFRSRTQSRQIAALNQSFRHCESRTCAKKFPKTLTNRLVKNHISKRLTELVEA